MTLKAHPSDRVQEGSVNVEGDISKPEPGRLICILPSHVGPMFVLLLGHII